MKKILIHDLPTRLFHWAFAGLFIFAYFIAKTVDSETYVYSYHMIAGLTISLAVVLRMIWGFVGSRHARFGSFTLNPKSLIEYFQDFFKSKTKKYVGHNPASSWAAIFMYLLALGLGITGFLMSRGQKETFEDIHELFANLFLAVAISHVVGIVIHTIRHKEAIGLSMVTGKKEVADDREAISSSRAAVGFLFIVVIAYFGVHAFRNFDPNTQTLQLFGTTLQLGENEAEEGGEGSGKKNETGESENKSGGDKDKDTDKDEDEDVD